MYVCIRMYEKSLYTACFQHDADVCPYSDGRHTVSGHSRIQLTTDATIPGDYFYYYHYVIHYYFIVFDFVVVTIIIDIGTVIVIVIVTVTVAVIVCAFQIRLAVL